MGSTPNELLLQAETTCGSLLYELQKIWDEVGENETSRDKMLLELEQECLQVYRRKVDQANRSRAQLRQAIADSEAELAAICSAMGELPVHIRQTEPNARSLNDELSTILPELEEMRKRKADRKNQFMDIIGQVQKVSTEIFGSAGQNSIPTAVDENDLSLRRFEELQRQLQSLQKEKSDRLKQVMEHLSVLSSLCSVLGLDFNETVRDLHPSLADNSGETLSISTETLKLMESAITRLREHKLQRMQRLQDLATMLVELWSLMDTPIEEQQTFQNVTCKIAALEDEITDPDMLSSDFIKHVETEVFRLEELKSSKMKELVLKKRAELEELCRKTHLLPEGDGELQSLVAAIETGALDPGPVLEQIEMEVAKVKEEAYSRKEILEKVEKWLSAREEEEWLEEYNMDENRYNAGRGAHLILKRAEKARTLANKLPGMVEALATKALNWENERGELFMYDGSHLLTMLEDYMIVRQEKEQEKKRQREQKKLQGQLITEQEAIFGSKPSPLKGGKKASRLSMGGVNNRRLSVGGGNVMQTPRPVSSQSSRATPNSRPVKKDDNPGTKTTARRALDVANLPTRNYTFNGRESEPASVRRPFSPVSSTTSSRANGDFYDDQNILKNEPNHKTSFKIETSQKPVTASNTVPTTPLKLIHTLDEENRTPNVNSNPVPSTPFTVSAPMQTTMTPAALSVYGGSSVEERTDEIEYSFEERRAGFVLPSTHPKRAILV
ncbi:65-kDa microtubule-associated protein 3-like [Silene latifolia]|uniref:65-kDa microtubule-associated protein 3-like n=1 Tax=Silene latifolia TaxID=37657 RepID=UPI003D76F452